MAEKLGQEPAFPVLRNVGAYHQGMNKRFYAACAAMQGILSNESGFTLDGIETTRTNLTNKVKFAFMCADELLKQENQ